MFSIYIQVMKILVIEPFFTGSHKQWIHSYQHSSQHTVEILSLPGRYWKWRMYGASVAISRLFQESGPRPDLIIASDMLDLSTFVALCRKQLKNVPIVLYFHENQITYPWSPKDRDIILNRNNQYGFINYTSALVADQIFYNSKYHKTSFLGQLPLFLKQFPDYQELQNIEIIKKKSEVLYLGMDLQRFDQYRTSEKNKVPAILWNHRWEYDKNPEDFYKALCFLEKEAIDFELIVLGEQYQKYPEVFDNIKKQFYDKIIHFGYATSFSTYARLLWQADILPVSSKQDFFGGSVVEAIYCNCIPLLPDRLAYPEHIPDGFKSQCIYINQNDFHQKLKSLFLHPLPKEKNRLLSDFVARYDWSNLANHYDTVFADLTKTNKI